MSSPVLVSPSAPHLRCRCSAPVRPRRTSFALSFAHLLQLVFGRAGGCRHIAPTLVAPAALRTRARRAGAAEDACLCCPDAFYGGCLSRAGSYVAETDRPCSREAIGSVCTKLKAINVSIFARRSRVLVPPTPRPGEAGRGRPKTIARLYRARRYSSTQRANLPAPCHHPETRQPSRARAGRRTAQAGQPSTSQAASQAAIEPTSC